MTRSGLTCEGMQRRATDVTRSDAGASRRERVLRRQSSNDTLEQKRFSSSGAAREKDALAAEHDVEDALLLS